MILGIGGNRDEVFDFDGTIDLDLRPDYQLVRPAKVQGKCINAGENAYVVSGSMSLTLKGVCAKCAEPASTPLEVPFQERFMKEPEDDEAYLFTGSELDLSQALTDNAILNLPGRLLCKEGCKGLCPICGTNQNEAECGCTANIENPFAVLRQLELPEEE